MIDKNKNEEVIVKRTEDGELVVTSRQVAEDFGKEHRNVVRAIENLTAQNSAVKNIMIKSTFEHRGNEYTEYLFPPVWNFNTFFKTLSAKESALRDSTIE